MLHVLIVKYLMNTRGERFIACELRVFAVLEQLCDAKDSESDSCKDRGELDTPGIQDLSCA